MEQPQRGFALNAPPQPDKDTLPGVVEPQDAGSVFIPLLWIEDNQGMDLTAPVVAWVTISTGERFQSKPTVLFRRLSWNEESPPSDGA
jgi:hypothetical protein